MKTATLILAAALLAGPADAQQPGPKADVQGSEAEKTKGYGYGTPSGTEAGGSAGQAVGEQTTKKGRKARKAKRAKAPQQEEGTTPSKGSGSPNAAAPQGAQQQGSHVQGGQAPAR